LDKFSLVVAALGSDENRSKLRAAMKRV